MLYKNSIKQILIFRKSHMLEEGRKELQCSCFQTLTPLFYQILN